MLLAMVDMRDGTGRVGLEDAILRTPKDVVAVNDVAGNTRHVEEELGGIERRSELGVAEDSTPGKSRLYKATVRTTSAEGSSGEGLRRDAQNTSQATTRE